MWVQSGAANWRNGRSAQSVSVRNGNTFGGRLWPPTTGTGTGKKRGRPCGRPKSREETPILGSEMAEERHVAVQ